MSTIRLPDVVGGSMEERVRLANCLEKGLAIGGIRESADVFLQPQGDGVSACVLGIGMLGKYGSYERALAADNAAGVFPVPDVAAICLGISPKLASRVEALFVDDHHPAATILIMLRADR